MKQIYKSISFIVGGLLFLSSCDLDKSPNGNASFWTSKEEVQLGLDAAYEPFYYEEGFGRGHWWAGPASDDMNINRNKTDDDNLTKFIGLGNNSEGQANNWELIYRTIRRANDVMRYVPEVQMTERERDIMLGEANFLSAYAYFHLAKRYGGLPFYDFKEPDNFDKTRETKEVTYQKIEQYLLEAISHFERQNLWTRSDDSWGRPNLGAAYGLLAKVYAHWATPSNYVDKYTKAKNAAKKVVDSGAYELNTLGNNGFANLFSPAGEKSSEVLFNLTNKAERGQGTVTSVICLSSKLSGGTGWYYFAPTRSLYEAFSPGDLRRGVTLKGVGDLVSYKPFIKKIQDEVEKAGGDPSSIKAPQAIRTTDIDDMGTGYMCAKYLSVYDNLDAWKWESGQDIPLLRYSDVLLIYAEAEIFLAGGGANNPTLGVSAAAIPFNAVHVRAFGNDVTKAIASPTFNDLVKERRCELAYEDERHYDLVRWGLAKDVYANTTVDLDPRGPRTFDPTKNAHFPLPQKIIDNSKGLLQNNPLPGYSSF